MIRLGRRGCSVLDGYCTDMLQTSFIVLTCSIVHDFTFSFSISHYPLHLIIWYAMGRAIHMCRYHQAAAGNYHNALCEHLMIPAAVCWMV